MAEFQEVMRQWKRRCEHCDAKEDVHCYVHVYTCEAFNKMKDRTNFKFVEEDIMKWASENPEPVYPTWGEWLNEQAVVIKIIDNGALFYEPNAKMRQPIPADIAEKLGLQPKER